MKEKMKYLVAVLIMATMGIMFIPILNIGNAEISMFNIIKVWLLGYDGSWLEQAAMSVISDKVEVYLYLIGFIVLLTIFDAVIVAVLNPINSYIYAIGSGIVVNIFMFIGYSKLDSKLGGIEAAIQMLGQSEYIYICKEPGMLWAVCYGLVLVLSLLGIVMIKMGGKKVTEREIVPEDFYFEKNPWENVLRDELMIDKNNQAYVPDKIPSFYGAIQGENGLFREKVYLLEELVPVYVVKKAEVVFLIQENAVEENTRNHMIDEKLAKIYYIPEYQEYAVIPFGKLKVYLESGQPLGKERRYYIPRATKIYFEDKNCEFTLA